MSSAAAGRPVILLTAPDCHLCEHARRVLSSIALELPLNVAEVPWDSDQGQQLVRRDGVAFPPAVYLSGRLAGYERISERALRRQLGTAQQ